MDDPDPRGRAAAVIELSGLVGEPPSDLVARVILLSDDADDQVRDAACFVLGRQWDHLESPALRNALAARLDDPHTDVRCEALLGLARRGDPRALPKVRDALGRPDGTLWELELEAAGALGDPSLHELVLEHLEGWDDDGEPHALAEAVRRLTDPAGPGDDLLAGVAELYRRRSRGQADGDALGWWRLMDRMLAIAPRRGRELFDGTARHLGTDPAARRWLREHSALAVTVAAADD